MVARGVLALMDGRAAPDACALALRRMHARVGGRGGTISLKPSGEVGVCFSTPRMAWACARGGEVRSGIDRALAERSGVVAIGLAHAFQLLDRVPHDSRDWPVDVIVTENGVHRVRK